MPWVRFNATFNFPATPAVTLRYSEGWTGSVTTRCANMAVAAGKAVRVRSPRKGQVVSDGAESHED